MPKQSNAHQNFPTDEQITELSDAVVSLEGQIEELAELTGAVLTLTEQVRCLRLAVDEIEAELGWAIRTKVLDRLPPPQFPCDERLWLNSPTDTDEAIEHVCDPDDLPVDELPAVPASPPIPARSTPHRQSNLW
jgi:hypothetical protein